MQDTHRSNVGWVTLSMIAISFPATWFLVIKEKLLQKKLMERKKKKEIESKSREFNENKDINYVCNNSLNNDAVQERNRNKLSIDITIASNANYQIRSSNESKKLEPEIMPENKISEEKKPLNNLELPKPQRLQKIIEKETQRANVSKNNRLWWLMNEAKNT